MLEETQERLDALKQLDERITDILAQGSRVVSALVSGKRADSPAARQEFKTRIIEYNDLVHSVNSQLHAEISHLFEASQTNLLPVNAPVKAVAFSGLKEAELWNSISADEEVMSGNK